MGSDGPSLNFTGSSGTSLLESITNFLQSGGSVGTVFKASFLGLFVSPFIAITDIISGIGTFFSTPFTEGGIAIGQLITALFTAPGSLLEAGSEVSENTLRTVIGPTWAGILALPITVGVVMLSLYIIVQYLQEDETGDSLPGLPFDTPDVLGLTLGVEEETPEEDQDNIG